MARNLNAHIIRAMTGITLVAFAVMYFGLGAYYFLIYDWLFPDASFDEKWYLSDTIVLGLVLATGLLSAVFVAWRLAQKIVKPLTAVAAAARAVAEGDFSARAQTTASPFGEAKSLMEDFNSMAERLQKAEAEVKYSNSSIAHELRTPLTILRGRLQGLLDGAFAPSPELYGRLIAHVDDLSAIVEELRTLALANVGKLELDLSEVDLAVEVKSVLVTVEQDLLQANIAVETTLLPSVVLADRTRIRQAILALLDNCKRYAPNSLVRLETGIEGEFAYLRCRDTGPGINPADRGRAFERFWRADESRTRSRGGSGLGLPIVRGIVRAHGGEALIIDQKQPGLAIELQLPRSRNA